MERKTITFVAFILLLSCIDVAGKPALNGKSNEGKVVTLKMNIFLRSSLIKTGMFYYHTWWFTSIDIFILNYFSAIRKLCTQRL